MNIGEIGQYRKILLLQGPRGLFFYRFWRHLASRGCTAYKINFNGGDELFYPGPDTFSFRGKFDEWESYLSQILREKKINAICLFGDCRPHHRVAIGVNGRSQIPCNPSFYRSLPEPRKRSLLPARTSFFRMAVSCSAYQLAELAMRWRYPNYRYHKYFSLKKEPYFWLLAGLRKFYYRFRERGIHQAVSGPLNHKYFLVPLQVYNDSQVFFHSKYHSVKEFIAEVIQSFAIHALPEHFLIIKHHPLDRGHKDYADIIERIAGKNHVQERVMYVHDVHLPTMLKNALGVVVINSTVGMSALHHNAPVKVMGTAIYDITGLTHQRKLDTFWREPKKIERKLYNRFRDYIIQYTQVNGSFYGLSPFKSQACVDGYQRGEQYAKSGQTK